MNSPNNASDKPSTAKKSIKILSPSDSQEHIDQDESTTKTTTQIGDRIKGDRATASKQDEDRRRRTIIVEKKNGTYGFTLQSYGIHYKKEREIEMITYVDYVEYDGPAYKAGMREGDVILSINGHDMEKADHKALVNFIKNCDTRMRMVVLFEDCVRKVELHIRYIQLQRILQSKTAELDRLCLKEREILQGKWKSHSLPGRKKAGSGGQSMVGDSGQEDSLCRPTVSTENVAHDPRQSQFLLAYQCIDPRYQCVIQSDNSTEFLVGWTRDVPEPRPIVMRTSCGDSKAKARCTAQGYHQVNGTISANPMTARSGTKSQKQYEHQTRHLCNPCVQAVNGQDNNSLEAYDLASPCCDPHCVPSVRKSKHKQKHSSQTKRHEHESTKENVKCGSSKDKQRDQGEGGQKSNHRHHKYISFGSNLMSQFSLHSCTSSDVSHGMEESSGVSYTTSLSSDTLFWDGNENKANSKQSHSRTSSCKSHTSCYNYQTFQPVKPKSWDNLTTKAFGGYGFGYGYIDAGVSSKNHGQPSSTCHTMPAKMKPQTRNGVINLNQINFKSKAGGRVHNIHIYHNGHHHYHVPPTKSSESLVLKQKQNPMLGNSSLSCECLEMGGLQAEDSIKRFFPSRSGNLVQCHQPQGHRPRPAGSVTEDPTQGGNVSRL